MLLLTQHLADRYADPAVLHDGSRQPGGTIRRLGRYRSGYLGERRPVALAGRTVAHNRALMGVPFILAGGIKIVYDLLLYRSFFFFFSCCWPCCPPLTRRALQLSCFNVLRRPAWNTQRNHSVIGAIVLVARRCCWLTRKQRLVWCMGTWVESWNLFSSTTWHWWPGKGGLAANVCVCVCVDRMKGVHHQTHVCGMLSWIDIKRFCHGRLCLTFKPWLAEMWTWARGCGWALFRYGGAGVWFWHLNYSCKLAWRSCLQT